MAALAPTDGRDVDGAARRRLVTVPASDARAGRRARPRRGGRRGGRRPSAHGAALRVQEASLTGESEAVTKTAATLTSPSPSATGPTWSTRAPLSPRASAAPSYRHRDGTPRWAPSPRLLEETGARRRRRWSARSPRVGKAARRRRRGHRRGRHGTTAWSTASESVGDLVTVLLLGVSLGGRGGARGAAGDPVARPGHRCARDGRRARRRQAAALGGDARLRLGDLLRQDRDPDPQRDDHRRVVTPSGTRRRYRRRLRARGRR